MKKEIKEISVKTVNGLDDCSIELLQQIERALDQTMVEHGFTRIRTSKSGESAEFCYRQFGKAF